MSNTINSNDILLSRFVSSLSCTWNSNSDKMEGAAGSAAEDFNVRTISYPSFSISDDGDHHHHQQQQQQSSSSSSVSSSSSSGKEDVQSKISNLMSRKVLYEAADSSESEEDQYLYHHQQQQQQQQQPGRMMLDNISDSFDQLVDARIRAYAQILSNHVQVLRSSNNNNNERGALIAQYKLRTLLEFASTSSGDDALFDSIVTKFEVISASDDDDIVSTTAATSTEKEEKLLLRAAIDEDNDDDDDDESSSENYNNDKTTTTTLPIGMIVEICSHRFRLQQEKYQEGFEEKLIFKTTGKMHGKRFLIGSSDDTTVRDYICLSRDGHDSCHAEHYASATTTSNGCCRHSILRNNANGNNNFAAAAIAQPQARLNEVFENAQHNHNIEIDINCEELLSQMIEEAGKVVTMIVELTNLAWTNNTKKQQEIDNIIELNNMTEANVIADDDNDSPSVEIYIPPPPTAGSKRRRPRSDSLDDALMGPPRNVHVDVKHHHHRRHVSELPFHRSGGSTLPLLPIVSEEESVVDVTTSPPSSSSSAITTTTFTNLDVVHRDTERKRKSRCYVSIDHSFEASTFSELDDEHHEDHHHHHHEEHEGEDALSPLPEEDSKNNNNDADVEYYKIAAERACDIVDFVFAGEEICKLIDVPTTATAVPSASSFSNKRLCVTRQYKRASLCDVTQRGGPNN